MGDLIFTCSPVPDGTPISGHFAQTEGYPHPHRGLDYGCFTGTRIVAPAAGTVVDFFNDGSFGNGVCLDHVDTPWYSLYAHLSSVSVSIGQAVHAGDELGFSGATGLVDGPHLHWQVCRDSTFPTDIARSADPLTFFAADGGTVNTAGTGGTTARTRSARVRGTAGCLRIRSTPSLDAPALGCFADGTLFTTSGETRQAEGVSWLSVTGPGGESGWASLEFLQLDPA
jgi:hypothetical protein